MNARLLIVIVVTAVVASLVTVGLLALFVVAFLAFANYEVRQQVELPETELARPPDFDDENAVTVHVTAAGTVMMDDREFSIAEAPPAILEQIGPLDDGQTLADVTVIIRAEPDAPTGTLQELIKGCQRVGLSRFAVRASE